MKKPSTEACEYFDMSAEFYQLSEEKGKKYLPLAIKYCKKAMKLNHPDSFSYMNLYLEGENEEDIYYRDEKSALLGSPVGILNLVSGLVHSRNDLHNYKVAYILGSFLENIGYDEVEHDLKIAIKKMNVEV